MDPIWPGHKRTRPGFTFSSAVHHGLDRIIVGRPGGGGDTAPAATDLASSHQSTPFGGCEGTGGGGGRASRLRWRCLLAPAAADPACSTQSAPPQLSPLLVRCEEQAAAPDPLLPCRRSGKTPPALLVLLSQFSVHVLLSQS